MLKLTPSTKNRYFEKIAQKKLMPLIPFDETDLAMNDDGFFSDAQKLRLKPKTDLYIALSSIGAFMAFVVALICFYMGRNTDAYVFITGVFIAIFGICSFGISWSLSLARQIKRGFGVKKIEGNAELYVTYSGKNDEIHEYNLRIKNVNFRLSQQVYDAFETGEYRVYYFRLLRNELLAVEPLG